MTTAAAYLSTNLFARFEGFRKRFGVKGAIFKSLDAVLHKALRTQVHRVVWLELKSVAGMAPPDESFRYRFISADELAAFAEEPSYFIGPSLVVDVRSGRTMCFAALAGKAASRLRLLHPEICRTRSVCGRSHFVTARCGLHVLWLHASRFSWLPTARAHHGAGTPGIGRTRRNEAGVASRLDELGFAEELRAIGLRQLREHDNVRQPKAPFGIYPNTAKELGIRFGRNARKFK